MKTFIRDPAAYRADIDGLRAVAVLSVVAYHIDESLVPGGFTGVDIFFVISGYLITTILARDIRAGRFSIAEFYRRRLLRIAPAYFAVTIATLLAGSMVLLPDDMRGLAVSAGWSALALPNVYFWLHLDTGYFATASNQVPLLHLWSLGVEEQFYVIWPLVLLLLGRWIGWRTALLWCVTLAAVGSFLVGQHAATSDSSFAYYMLPARAGELLVGGLLALRGVPAGDDNKHGRFAAEVSALFGLILIAWGLFGLDSESIFPGFNALYPTVGTALLIYAGIGGTPSFSRFLRWKPVVFIGLISYSLYLWHWPILALMRYTVTTLSLQMELVAVLGMLLASYASYRWIEVPFRQGRPSRVLRSHALASYAAFVLVIGGVAFGLVKVSDVQESRIVARHEAQLLALTERMQAAFAYDYNCQRSTYDPKLVTHRKCVIGEAGAVERNAVRALLVGDSNAAHYIGVLGAIAESEGFAFRNLSVSSCPPLFGGGDKYGKPTDRQGCSRYRAQIRKQTRKYPYVLLGAQWTSHSRTEGFEKDLNATLRELGRNGATVVLLGQVPRFASFNQNCEIARISKPALECEAASGGGVVPRINERLKELANRYSHVEYMDVSDIICPKGACSPYLASAPIYFDAGHLSMTGSWDVGREIVAGGIPLADVFRGMRQGASAVPTSHSMSNIR
ncbi:acyltransferase family protein [Luteimonas salinilitoris]|uniref:Acyltransferase family protein n=1 Tax=Luteimonas salinilitoris TaxID=3237697 RepID=A0ABV4HWK3_9GAMM